MGDGTESIRTPDLDYFFRATFRNYVAGEIACETHVSHIYPRQAKIGIQCGAKTPVTDQFIGPSGMGAKDFADALRGTLHMKMREAGFDFKGAINRWNRLYERPEKK